jgi:hypothetical protein
MRKLIPPLVVFFAQRVALFALAFAARVNPFAAHSWIHWDSHIYLFVAAHGYRPPVLCGPEQGEPPGTWCGVTGWFPAYPWLVRLTSATGLSQPFAALLVSAAAQLGCLVLLSRCIDHDQDRDQDYDRDQDHDRGQDRDHDHDPDPNRHLARKRAPAHWPALLLGAFFFGSVYSAAPFPVSLCLFCILLCLHRLLSARYPAAALAGALAAMSYPPAIFLAPVVLLWGALQMGRRQEARTMRGAALVAAGIGAGVAAVFLTFQLEAGSWRSFFQVQAAYHYSGNFLDTLGAQLKPLVNARYRNPRKFATAAQTLVVLAFAVTLATQWWRRRAEPRVSLLLLYLAVFWCAPLALGGRLSLYRSESLLLPVVLLVPGLTRRAQLLVLAAALVLFVPMGILFFRNILI